MYTGEELLELWLSSGLSQRQLAAKLGMKFNALHGKIFRAQKAKEANLTQKVDTKQEGNLCEVEAKGPRIQTLEQLIEACKIDLEEWVIERHVINKWEVGAKVDGLVNLIVEPLFQVKVWLKKRSPEPIYPVISPVAITAEYKKSKNVSYKEENALILADPHFGYRIESGEYIPFHDPAALKVALDFAHSRRPKDIVILGDLLDLAEWSDKFIRTPDMYNTTQPAIEAAAEWLLSLRIACPKSNIYLMEGNHEKRLLTAITKQMPYAYGLKTTDGLPVLSIENLLDLKSMDIEWVGDYPNGQVWINDDLRVIHGDKIRNKSGATATALLEDITVSTVFGHVHRQELASKTIYDRYGAKIVSAFSPGCLCRIDGEVPGTKDRQNWQQGIGYIEIVNDVSIFHPISIVDGYCYFEGMQYEGFD
ncbi:MAG: hypothetical protein AMJ53_15395 [Gammaproteobacteria bacterium SG8_11]|nr:MAG: hypothetical protein AMJ53_15395 [Gammaproteobacteria bacterium SG8_11]